MINIINIIILQFRSTYSSVFDEKPMMKQIPFHGPFRKNFQKILPRDYASKSHFHVAPAKKLDMSEATEYYFSRDKRPFDFSKTLSVMRRQQLSKNGDNYFCEKSFHKIFQKPVTNIFLQIC